MHNAFTIHYSWISNRPLTNIKVVDDEKKVISEWVALWDTWATISCISEDFVKKLWLSPIDIWNISWVWWQEECWIYSANVILPNNVWWTLKLSWITAKIDCDVLIWMDIISQWDFALSVHEWQTVFSFCLPSRRKIDFVEQVNSAPPKWIRPNDKCHCWSGKKFKHCHWK